MHSNDSMEFYFAFITLLLAVIAIASTFRIKKRIQTEEEKELNELRKEVSALKRKNLA